MIKEKTPKNATLFPKPKPINKRLKTKKQLPELSKTTLEENKAKFMQELQQSFREMKEGKTRPIECLINELENAGND